MADPPETSFPLQPSRRRARALAGLLFLAGAVPPADAAAAPDPEHEVEKLPVVIWPTLTPAGDAPSPEPLHRPSPSEKELFERAQELEDTLRDAVQDLGFTLYVADPGPAQGHTRDQDLVERAAHAAARGARNEGEEGTWVVSPRIESAGGGQYVVRIVVVAPRAHELRVRVETVAREAVSVRGLVMLRDMLSRDSAAAASQEWRREQAAGGTAQGIMSPLRSQGRAVLAASAGLFGAFTAFALQRASGSEDPRVLYPLLALGTGIGIGGALLVADEWDVSSGDAWYLTAGAAWAAGAGFLIAAGHNVQPLQDRYAWGVGGGLAGLALATVALTRNAMDDGDALLAHSGGALGLLLGGAVDAIGRGSTASTPYTGMGYGSALGLVAAGALAGYVHVSPSRVLLVDLGAGGGALVGAAAASPLIFQNQTPGNTRGWLSASVAGSLAGGLLTWWLTREPREGPPPAPGGRSPSRWGTPTAGLIGVAVTPPWTRATARDAPIYGIGWSGTM
jgi:hypothetical protein